MKPFAVTLEPGTSLANKTGSWRTNKPLYVRKLPPCNNACPAGENIQAWLSLAQKNKYKDAWLEIMKNNPFPAIMGRACYHLCEKSCNRLQFDSSVNIHAIERFIGDLAINNDWEINKLSLSPNAKKIFIIGAGPSGLSAAYHLIKMGHKVDIFESEDRPGGMMRFGIPKYRLPDKIIDAEIQRILNLGVTLHTNTKINNVSELLKNYDAGYLAIGAWKPRILDICKNSPTALDFFKNNSNYLCDSLAVYGGGNTAFDVARIAIRLGIKSVSVVYRKTRELMPAYHDEIEEALAEGVKLTCLREIKSISGNKIKLEKILINENQQFQASKEYETIEADHVIMAIGQLVDSDFLTNLPDLSVSADGTVHVNAKFETGVKSLFAGGDMIASVRTITDAIGHGKKAAKFIDDYLAGEITDPTKKKAPVKYEELNVNYFNKSSRTEEKSIDINKRKTSFSETHKTISEQQACDESKRCFSCGNCFECNNCYAYCPDNAIIKRGEGKFFSVNYDYCKGCGICVKECPCSAMQMTSEEK